MVANLIANENNFWDAWALGGERDHDESAIIRQSLTGTIHVVSAVHRLVTLFLSKPACWHDTISIDWCSGSFVLLVGPLLQSALRKSSGLNGVRIAQVRLNNNLLSGPYRLGYELADHCVDHVTMLACVFTQGKRALTAAENSDRQ